MASKTKASLPDDDEEQLTLALPNAFKYADSTDSTFRRKFINTGLVQLIDLGGRSPHVLKSQLREAILKIAADQAADPSLVKPRSGGAVLKVRGVIGNKWGRLGKPAPAAKAAKALRK